MSEREREFSGPIWKHPYMIYIWLTTGLFGVLLLIAWLAYSNGCIPGNGL